MTATIGRQLPFGHAADGTQPGGRNTRSCMRLHTPDGHYALPPGVPSWSVAASMGGGPMTGADEIRDVQRATWAGLSAGWEKWDSVIMEQLGPVGAAMIERLDIAVDQQHLEIAAGTGEPGLSIARLSPKGRVVLTDLAAEMLDVAARRAMAQGVANVETRVCSADALPFDDET